MPRPKKKPWNADLKIDFTRPAPTEPLKVDKMRVGHSTAAMFPEAPTPNAKVKTMTIADETTLDERIRGYDWEHAFQCCGPAEAEATTYNDPNVSAALGSSASAEPFQRFDVAEVLATSDGENDGLDWVGVFRLKDGRFAYLEAGCDYTGWDCQSGGHAIVSHDLAHLIQFGLTEAARSRLALKP
jgi:hypothetical protein